MYTNNRDAYRQAFFIAWDKYKKKLPLEPVESQLIEVILLHPEYHALLERPNAYEQQEFTFEENPFIRMSLHLTVREQVRTNRPAGVTAIYQELLKKYINGQEVEYRMMECLAKILLHSQQSGTMPNEEEYLKQLKVL